MSKLIVSFDERAVKDELRELVRKTIEETINAMLDEEADRLVGAGPYERTDERGASRTSARSSGEPAFPPARSRTSTTRRSRRSTNGDAVI